MHFFHFACLSKTLQNPRLAITTILPKVNRNVFTNYFCSSQENKLVSTKPTFNTSPTSQKTITASLLCRWGNDALTKDVGKFIINSWVEKTKKQYRTYFDQQKEFCQNYNFSLTNASIPEGPECLLMLYRKGLSYSVINTARNMLFMILPGCDEFGKHPSIARMLKGIFRNQSTLPRHIVTYFPDLVLDFLKSLPLYHTEMGNTKNCHHFSIITTA